MDRRRASTLLSTRLFNPLVKAATNARLSLPGIAILETRGRKTRRPKRGTMAFTTDAQCIRFRAVFVERERRETGVDLADLESAVTLLDAFFKVAWAISDGDTLRLEAEFRTRVPHGSGGEAVLLRRWSGCRVERLGRARAQLPASHPGTAREASCREGGLRSGANEKRASGDF